jgi:hypothetical protein
MPPQEAGYTYAVEPTAVHSLLANQEESIYDIPRPPATSPQNAGPMPDITQTTVYIS